jgi:hypothetical protein
MIFAQHSSNRVQMAVRFYIDRIYVVRTTCRAGQDNTTFYITDEAALMFTSGVVYLIVLRGIDPIYKVF